MSLSSLYFTYPNRVMTADQFLASRDLYIAQPNKKAFLASNGLSNGSQSLYPGQLILAPPPGVDDEQVVACAQNIRAPLDYHWRNGASAGSPDLLNNNFDLLAAIASLGDKYGYLSKVESFGSKLAKRHLADIQLQMRKLNGLYNHAHQTGVPLNSGTFKDWTRPVRHKLDQLVPSFSKSLLYQRPNATSARDALGISHRSLNKQFKATTNAVEIKELTSTIAKLQGVSKRIETVGKGMEAVGLIISAAEVANNFSEHGAEKGFRSMATTASGHLGGMGGAYVGAKAGLAGATALVAFGVATGGAGLLLIGVGVAAGAVAGGYAGEELGKLSAEGWIDGLNLGVSSAIDWYYRE